MLYRNLEFFAEIWISDFVTWWYYMPSFSGKKKSEWLNKNWRRSSVLNKEIWNSWNSWHCEQKFGIKALLQGNTIYLVSPVKNSEWSNKNWRRSSDLKQKLTDDDDDDDGQTNQ